MGRTDKKIERNKEELNKLHNKVLKAKKFTKLKDWKQFRANVNKGDKNLWKYDINGKCLDDNGSNLIMEVEQ